MGAVLFDHPRRAGLRMGSHRGLPVGLLRRAWPGPADGLQGGEIGGMGRRRHATRPDALPAQQRQARALAMHCSNSGRMETPCHLTAQPPCPPPRPSPWPSASAFPKCATKAAENWRGEPGSWRRRAAS
ncbi:hypothetical protein G6F22_018661 [Rhizopus arrhizus]|nr:hypothetical protein G6F22_018661 [Rhizopus arrhizus]